MTEEIARKGTDELRSALAALPMNEREAYWHANVYRHETRQLTVRAAIMGALLGGVMSTANVYAGLKTGWTFGATITAGIMAFAIFKALERVLPGGEFTDLENNAMQSVSSAAGFMASAGLATSIPALVLMGRPLLPPVQLAIWLVGVSLIGVMVAVPLKRQMINMEQLPFPSGIAAAETIKGLHSEGEQAMKKARVLTWSAIIGALVAYFRDGNAAFVGKFLPQAKALAISIPSSLSIFPGVRGIPAEKLTLGLDMNLLLYAAGALVGARTGISLLLGSLINWFFIAPWLIEHAIEVNHKVIKGGFGSVAGWSAWPASGLLLAAALTATALQWRAFASAFSQVAALFQGKGAEVDERSKAIEVPMSWVAIGMAVAIVFAVWLQWLFFAIPIYLGLLAVVMAMVLSLVVARATGETDIAPPVGKLSQIANAALTQGNPVLNLMTANVTVGATIHAADCLTDLKSGYLLGARPRQQFIAQLIGVGAGSLFAVPAFLMLVPNDKVLGEKFAAPGAFTSKATAEAMANGLGAIPPTALRLMAFTIVLSIVLTLIETYFPKARRFVPSPVGLGLGMIQPFGSALAICAGALIAWGVGRFRPVLNERYTVAAASGLIAGESIMAVIVAGLMLYFNL
ncbi:MAG: Oligopeptide transporter, family [Cyanobacteria bacterium RYN_339]|nr:Oligopeptide transporter, family [Cyanobacteria bacterium RYN_339]